MRFRTLAIVAAALVLAACDRKQEPSTVHLRGVTEDGSAGRDTTVAVEPENGR